MNKTDIMLLELSKHLTEDELKYVLYAVHKVHEYEEILDKIKTYISGYKEIKGYYDKEIYDEDLKENILSYIGEDE